MIYGVARTAGLDTVNTMKQRSTAIALKVSDRKGLNVNRTDYYGPDCKYHKEQPCQVVVQKATVDVDKEYER